MGHNVWKIIKKKNETENNSNKNKNSQLMEQRRRYCQTGYALYKAPLEVLKKVINNTILNSPNKFLIQWRCM